MMMVMMMTMVALLLNVLIARKPRGAKLPLAKAVSDHELGTMLAESPLSVINANGRSEGSPLERQMATATYPESATSPHWGHHGCARLVHH